MKILRIIPNEGIGSLKLGMKRHEIEKHIRLLAVECTTESKLDICDYGQEGRLTQVRYFCGALFLIIYYNQQNDAVSIGLDHSCLDLPLIAELFGQNFFQLETEYQAAFLMEHGNCYLSNTKVLFSDICTCPALGIHLWRENWPDEEQVSSPDWKKHVGEDEYYLLHFQMIFIFDPEYGKELAYF